MPPNRCGYNNIKKNQTRFNKKMFETIGEYCIVQKIKKFKFD